MGSLAQHLWDTGLFVGHVIMKTIGQGIVQPAGEHLQKQQIVLNPSVLSAGDWNIGANSACMQIDKMREGYSHPQKESPLN